MEDKVSESEFYLGLLRKAASIDAHVHKHTANRWAQ